MNKPFEKRLFGRVAAENVKDKKGGILVKKTRALTTLLLKKLWRTVWRKSNAGAYLNASYLGAFADFAMVMIWVLTKWFLWAPRPEL